MEVQEYLRQADYDEQAAKYYAEREKKNMELFGCWWWWTAIFTFGLTMLSFAIYGIKCFFWGH